MTKKIIYFILILALMIISFFVGRYSKKIEHPYTPVNDTIATKIEKIIVRNDSLLRINDSINFKVIEIEKTYEKTVDDIIRNNPIDDYNFFSAYTERYSGINNYDSAKISEFNIRGASDVKK